MGFTHTWRWRRYLGERFGQSDELMRGKAWWLKENAASPHIRDLAAEALHYLEEDARGGWRGVFYEADERRSEAASADSRRYNDPAVPSEPSMTLSERLTPPKSNSDELDRLTAENARLRALINTPETENFMAAVPLEAAHQIERWGEQHDSQKSPLDWYWTLGYLGGKCAHSMLSGDITKAKHHCITVAALAMNWHRRLTEAKQ